MFFLLDSDPHLLNEFRSRRFPIMRIRIHITGSICSRYEGEKSKLRKEAEFSFKPAINSPFRSYLKKLKMEKKSVLLLRVPEFVVDVGDHGADARHPPLPELHHLGALLVEAGLHLG